MVENAKGHLEIKNVSKSFTNLLGETVLTVDDVSLDILPGEFVCIMGPSGCGKTTLLRMIAGLAEQDKGEILLDGNAIRGPGFERGLVFQNPELFKWMDVEENIAFGLKARHVYEKEKDSVREYIKLVGLEGFEKSLPHHLSGGMQQRAAVARALINHPTALLLDEPFGALDAFTRIALQERIIEIWKQFGMTAVMVTHDVEEAVVLGTRIVVMSDRPAKVIRIIDNKDEFPRDRNSDNTIALKREIISVMDSGE